MLNKAKAIRELSEFISFPTVSSDKKSESAIQHCAEWLKDHFYSIGMQKVKIYSTSTHPVVYSEYITNPSLKTILFYGHYDVQPIDPIKKWLTPPFKAVIKGEYILGRGASDDKGQVFIHIKAVEQLLQQKNSLPVNIKFLIEGAEEIGSVGLKDFIMDHSGLLNCDAAVVSDTKMVNDYTPAITYSLRGSLNAEIFIKTSSKDLHSGTFGGAVPNAAIELCSFISKLYNKDGTIAIPGFYDDVKKITIQERNFIRSNEPSNSSLIHDAGVMNDWGEKQYTMHERTTIRPSLSVTGVTSGFQGSGIKNAIPCAASAKLNFRLVPNQQPEKIKMLLEKFIKTKLPAYANSKVIYSSLSNPVHFSGVNRFMAAAIKAYKDIFKEPVKLIGSGGTIAAVDYLHTILKVPVVLMGFAQASDNMHAPNEKMYLPNFFRGIETSISFLRNLSSINHKFINHAAISSRY